MTPKSDLVHIATNAATSPKVAAPVAAATTGMGLNELFGWLESGVGLAAAMLGIMVSVAMLRNFRLRNREAVLRIEALERELGKHQPEQ